MKIKHTILFILSVFLILGLIVAFFPKDGIKITKDFVLYFPNFDDLLPSNPQKEEKTFNVDSLAINQIDIDEVIPKYEEQPDTTSDKFISDNSEKLSHDYNIDDIRSKITPIEFPEGDPSVLDNFFKKLSNHGEFEKIRVMHYGDSQIEGDRITAYIRYKLQSRFGGNGVGLCSPVAVYAQYSLKQENSDNWFRCPGFGRPNEKVKHKKYGPMIAFDRFSPVRDSSWIRPNTKYSSWLKFYKSPVGYQNTRKFKNIYIYYGNSIENVKVTIKSNDSIVNEGNMLPTERLGVYAYKSKYYIDNIKIEFEAYDSPDFYAISLEDDKGIYVDNIAMRGSSGTVFATTDRSLLSESYKKLDVDLFILQFGGNSIPYTKTLKDVRNFTNYFVSQIRVIRSMCPNASILVVGPSDMSVKIKDNYETYPILDTMIMELKNVSLKNKCAYWDIYKAMGGKNSMPQWVNADPPLAATDYTHFSPQGAYLISNMLYNSIIVEYSNFLERNGNSKKSK